MRLRHGAASHVGLIRRQNEDSFVAGGGIYAVCDGMGGARAGEVASETACRVLMSLPPEPTRGSLQTIVAEANHAILTRSLEEPALAGMGTTLTAVVQAGDGVTVAHVGDSRAYLLHAGVLVQLTDDHSLVAEMVRRGQLTAAQAAVHPHRSVITRALGTEDDVVADIFSLALEQGDRLLICSDGLSGMVPDEEIGRLLGAGDDLDQVALSLVTAALEGGGEDNVTVVVVAAEEGEGAEGPPAEDPQTGMPALPVGTGGRPEFGPEQRRAVSAHAGGAGRSGPAVGWFSSRRRILLAVLAVVVLVLVLGIVGLAAFNSTVYFVGTTPEGAVALFHGMPHSILGWQMYSLVEVGGAAYASLNEYLKARVDTHELVSKEEGQQFVRSLAAQP
jgi:PPM family protein phosphatase